MGALRGVLADTVEDGPRCRVLVGGEVASAGVSGRFLAKKDHRCPDRQGSHVLIVINEDKKGVGAEYGEDYISSAAEEASGWWSGKNGHCVLPLILDARRVESRCPAHPRTPLTKAVNTSYRLL